MKMIYSLLWSVWLCMSFIAVPAFARPAAMVTVKVLDEDGNQVSDANVRICFAESSPRELRKGLTDKDGVFAATAPCVGHVIYNVTKEGCYYSTGEYWFPDGNFLRWTPWNPTFELVLKKIGQPVPMYARRIRTKFPELGKTVGFDLIQADWVAPYGKGKIGDFLITITKRVGSREDYDAVMTVAFSNPSDGIQPVMAPFQRGSKLRLPRNAPAEGYEKQWTIKKGREPGRAGYGKTQENRNFFFRVRSVKTDGRITKALYGKIDGDFGFYPVTYDTAGLKICYYLNPDGTRNVEFDPKRNLFKDLGPTEEVVEP